MKYRAMMTATVLAGVATLSAMAVTVLIDDDFESGYTDGNITGQTAPNGQTWFDHPWHPSDIIWGDFGLGGKGAGPDLAVHTHGQSVIPLGRRVNRDHWQHVLYVRGDVRGGGPNIVPDTPGCYAQLDATAGNGSPEWSWANVGVVDYGDANRFVSHGRHFLQPAYLVPTGNGWIDSATTNWFRCDATYDLAAGTARYTYYERGNPANSNVSDFSWDPDVHDVQFDGVHIILWRHADGQSPWPGVDNLYVAVGGVPPPRRSLICIR